MTTPNKLIKLILLLIFFLQLNSLFSQIGFQDYEFDSTKTYKISHTEGLAFIGTFTEKKEDIAVFRTKAGSEITCAITSITGIRIVSLAQANFQDYVFDSTKLYKIWHTEGKAFIGTFQEKRREAILFKTTTGSEVLCPVKSITGISAGSSLQFFKPWLLPAQQAVSGPDSKSPLMYLHVRAGGVMNGLHGGFGASIVFPKNYGFSFHRHGFVRKAKRLPSNYDPGIFLFAPRDHLATYSFNLLFELPTSDKNVKFGVEPGISKVVSHLQNFTGQPDSWLGSNYITHTKTETGFGFNLRLKAELPISRVLGFETAIITTLNTYQSYIGWEFAVTLGYIRRN